MAVVFCMVADITMPVRFFSIFAYPTWLIIADLVLEMLGLSVAAVVIYRNE